MFYDHFGAHGRLNGLAWLQLVDSEFVTTVFRLFKKVAVYVAVLDSI